MKKARNVIRRHDDPSQEQYAGSRAVREEGRTYWSSATLSVVELICLAAIAAYAVPSSAAQSDASAAAASTHAAVVQRIEGGTVDADGTIRTEMVAPLSGYLSPQARAFILDWLKRPLGFAGNNIGEVRANYDRDLAIPTLAAWRKIYSVDIDRSEMAGIPISTIVPSAGIDPRNAHRIAVNVHGGGFKIGSLILGEAEAVPLAGVGKIKVISIDYRMAPEYRFPAASEDVEKVYRELLKTYKPQNIVIYGCSAGGQLSAQAAAWFQKQKLPEPGALGVFCAGAGGAANSDAKSTFNSGMISGAWPAGGDNSGRGYSASANYFAGVEPDDRWAYPANAPEVLARFPPTFIITGTRDMALSAAVVMNTRLLAAGAESQLYVQEGLGHGFLFLMPGVPEAVAAYTAAWGFFDRHLGR